MCACHDDELEADEVGAAAEGSASRMRMSAAVTAALALGAIRPRPLELKRCSWGIAICADGRFDLVSRPRVRPCRISYLSSTPFRGTLSAPLVRRKK